MPISIFLFMLVAFWIVGAVQSGALVWVSAKVVRLKDLSIKRAIVWGVVAAVVQIAAWVAAEFASPDVGDTIEGLAALAVVITIAVLLKRVGSCGKGRAISATLIWIVVSMVVWLPEFFVMRATVVMPFSQAGEAMKPMILETDSYFVDRTLAPRRWDVITFHDHIEQGHFRISRLIGLPGETVEIIDGDVHINGKATPLPVGMIDIAYKSDFPARYSAVGVEGNPITLGEDEYFVLGDNTGNSFDSRLWEAANGRQAGALPKSKIVGVVRMVYSPLSRFRLFR